MITIKNKIHTNLLNIFNKRILTNYRIILELNNSSPKIIKKIQDNQNCTLIHHMCDLNIICCIVSHKLLNMLINSPEVKYISFDSEVFLCGNKLYSEIEKPNYKTMTYNTNLTGKNIRIGIIDSGIYPLNIFIKPKNRIVLFKDFINNISYPYDDNGHGTAMCNIIGGNFIYKNTVLKNSSECDFCVIKTFDKYNKSYCSLIFKAIDLIYEISAKFNIQILYLPFELHEFNKFILDIFQILIDKISKSNIIVLVPSGNNSTNYCSLKGLSLLDNCLVVGGINFKDSSKGIYSNKFIKPNIVSIYENIYLQNINTKYVPEKNNQYIYPTKPNNSLIEYFGTSCSCAYVCALITLLKQKNISVNINDVMSLLKISCNKTNNLDDSIQGLGTINLTQLLE